MVQVRVSECPMWPNHHGTQYLYDLRCMDMMSKKFTESSLYDTVGNIHNNFLQGYTVRNTSITFLHWDIVRSIYIIFPTRMHCPQFSQSNFAFASTQLKIISDFALFGYKVWNIKIVFPAQSTCIKSPNKSPYRSTELIKSLGSLFKIFTEFALQDTVK